MHAVETILTFANVDKVLETIQNQQAFLLALAYSTVVRSLVFPKRKVGIQNQLTTTFVGKVS